LLQVVKWVGAGLFLLQLVTLLLSCGLQSAYATAEEAAEDEEEEAAWRRRPLLQGEGRAPTPPWGVLGWVVRAVRGTKGGIAGLVAIVSASRRKQAVKGCTEC
jgi:hypothetical protein